MRPDGPPSAQAHGENCLVKGPAQPIVPPTARSQSECEKDPCSQSCHPRRAANQNARSYHAERLPLSPQPPNSGQSKKYVEKEESDKSVFQAFIRKLSGNYPENNRTKEKTTASPASRELRPSCSVLRPAPGCRVRACPTCQLPTRGGLVCNGAVERTSGRCDCWLISSTCPRKPPRRPRPMHRT